MFNPDAPDIALVTAAYSRITTLLITINALALTPRESEVDVTDLAMALLPGAEEVEAILAQLSRQLQGDAVAR